ncbi:MAG: hypothetical protein KDD61_10910, partial [Bdellovibrionales bacterium]|nr:hypothetical protein [Bdellovibrionales bacterium]
MEAKLVINPTEYTILETLGEGLSGCVYKAIRSSGNYTHSQKVALKILNSGTEVSKWRIEIEQGMRIQSSYCSSIYGWEISGTQL